MFDHLYQITHLFSVYRFRLLFIIILFLVLAVYADEGEVLLHGPAGSTILKVGSDDDGDSIDNELEVNGFTYSISDGLQAWDGDSSKTWYKTDPLRWSTDGDPYSDFMEVSGINMPSAISAPENHPLVAARPVISIRMEDYDVIPLEEISDSEGGDQSSSFTNEVSNSDEVSASVTVEASLNPFELVGGSATASYSHTWTTTESSTNAFGSNWNNTRTINPDQAARLKLRIYMVNKGGATALDVAPTINLKLGQKTISTFVPSQRANILTPPGTSDNRFPRNGTILVEEDENANNIIITLDELKAIQMGTPLSLEVVQVDAKVVRWNANDQDWNSDIEWASFESEINPVSLEVLAELGDGENYRYEVFAGTPYWDPEFTLGEILDLIFDKNELEGVTYIENRKYPDQWYLSSPSQIIIDEWTNSGQPSNMLGLRMHRNSRLVMMSPGPSPAPTINLATYSADYKNVLISARPNNFPILSAQAEIPINGVTKTFDLVQGDNSFFSMETELNAIPDGPGKVTVTNARGDQTTATIILPAIYASPADVKAYSAFLPNPGGEFWIYQNGDETKPMLLFCQFFSRTDGSELAEPRAYITLPQNVVPAVFSEFNAYAEQYRFWYDKIRLNAQTLVADLSDTAFVHVETVVGNGPPPEYLYDNLVAGQALWTYPEIDSAEAQIDLSGTPFRFAVSNLLTQNVLDQTFFDKERRKLTVKRTELQQVSNNYFGYAGPQQTSFQLAYGYDPVPLGQGAQDNGQALQINAETTDGYVNMWAAENLRLTGDFTIEAWIFPTGPGSHEYWGGIILNREGEYEICRRADGMISWAVSNSSPGWNWQSTNYYAPEQQWLHIALVYNQSTMKVYFNGELFMEQAATGPVGDYTPNDNNLRFGARSSISNTQRFEGVIDEVRIWNRIRNGRAIKSTYADTLNAAYYANADSGLIGYWRLDEAFDMGEGVLETPDLSVNQNNGTLYGDVKLTDLPTEIGERLIRGPADWMLEQNYPNPFNPVTTIRYQLRAPANVEITVYNMRGRKVRTLLNDRRGIGTYSVQWNGRSDLGHTASSGVYVYRLLVNGQPVQARKMLLVR